MDTPPSPHSSAVSGLMQQLKSGEISKIQLFQEIARLQAKATRSAPPNATMMPPSSSSQSAPPPVPLSLSTTMQATPMSAFGNMGLSTSTAARTGTSQLFSAPSYGAAPVAPASMQHQAAPAHFSTATSGGAALASEQLESTRAASVPGNFGRTGVAPIVESDAEFLASGVSHDKAQRFSVQEWMATKQRGNAAAAQPSNASATTAAPSLAFLFSQTNQSVQQQRHLPLPGEQLFGSHQPSAAASVSVASNLFAFSQQRVFGVEEPTNASSSIRMLDSQAFGVSTSPDQVRGDDQYEYNPQRTALNQQQQYASDSENRDDPPGSNEQGFIDFTEHFREDIDGAGPTGGGGGGASHAGNLTGKGSKIAAGATNNTSGGDDAFHARVTRWKSQKDAVREQMKQQLLQSELDECTFAPKVNPKSTKVAAKLRTRQGGSAKEYTSSPLEVSERLYQEADNYKAREELAQRVKAEEEADLERECTFKPKINRASALTEKVKAKYMDVQKTPSPSLTAAAMESTAKELEQCTFSPKVNPISTEMVSAQLYLQQDIYERLSRPCCMTTPDSPVKSGRLRRRTGSLTDDDISRDTDSDLASSLASPRRSQDDFYIRSLSPRRGRSLATDTKRTAKQRQQQRPRSADGIRNDGNEKDERARQLDNFLERQQFHEEARRKKIEATKQHLLPTHKPTINKKSLDMMENGRKGDFLERITKYALRKEHADVKNKSVRVSDPHCTFKPAINQTSTKRKGRSVTELSRGDLLRRETTQRLMKLKMEQEEMAALTFRPQLNRVSERHEGKLKILTSPDTYLERIHQQSQAHTIKQRRAVQEKELEEFAECTFKPRTIEAPAYVQRIARSVSLTKALKQQQLAATRASDKPEWK